jgi:hypothetical protein
VVTVSLTSAALACCHRRPTIARYNGPARFIPACRCRRSAAPCVVIKPEAAERGLGALHSSTQKLVFPARELSTNRLDSKGRPQGENWLATVSNCAKNAALLQELSRQRSGRHPSQGSNRAESNPIAWADESIFEAVDILWLGSESVGESAIYARCLKAVDGRGRAPPGVAAGIYDSCVLRPHNPLCKVHLLQRSAAKSFSNVSASYASRMGMEQC